MLRLAQTLLFLGLTAAALGIPITCLGLPVVLINGDWTISHFGTWLMGAGFLAIALGASGMYFFGLRRVNRFVDHFVRQQQQRSGTIIEVNQLPQPEE